MLALLRKNTLRFTVVSAVLAVAFILNAPPSVIAGIMLLALLVVVPLSLPAPAVAILAALAIQAFVFVPLVRVYGEYIVAILVPLSFVAVRQHFVSRAESPHRTISSPRFGYRNTPILWEEERTLSPSEKLALASYLREDKATVRLRRGDLFITIPQRAPSQATKKIPPKVNQNSPLAFRIAPPALLVRALITSLYTLSAVVVTGGLFSLTFSLMDRLELGAFVANLSREPYETAARAGDDAPTLSIDQENVASVNPLSDLILADLPSPLNGQVTVLNGGASETRIQTIADRLARLGIPVAHVGRADHFSYRGATLHYRPGTERTVDEIITMLTQEFGYRRITTIVQSHPSSVDIAVIAGIR